MDTTFEPSLSSLPPMIRCRAKLSIHKMLLIQNELLGCNFTNRAIPHLIDETLEPCAIPVDRHYCSILLNTDIL